MKQPLLKANPFFSVLLLALNLILLPACQEKRSSQATYHQDTTTIYLVRHAEKDLADKGEDPALIPEGQARALRLLEELEAVPLHAIYSTRFQRNMNTVKPLAEKKNLSIEQYEWHGYEALMQGLPEKHWGETILICGHGDNLLPMIRLLGAAPPLDSLGAYEYDKLFKVSLSKQDTSVQMTIF